MYLSALAWKIKNQLIMTASKGFQCDYLFIIVQYWYIKVILLYFQASRSDLDYPI